MAQKVVGENMIREIPIQLVKANQILFVAGTVTAIVFHSKPIVYFLFLSALSALLFGPRANIAFRIARPIFSHRLYYAKTEYVDLQRFNQIIATTCLFLSSFSLLFFDSWIGWVFAGFVTIAASAALMGYCIGCTLFYPYKMSISRNRLKYPWLNFLFDFIAGTGPFRPPLQMKYQPMMLMGLAHESIREALRRILEKSKSLTEENLPDIIEDIQHVSRCIAHHANQEDHRMYPPIDAKRPGITSQFVTEHEDGDAMLSQLKDSIAKAQKDSSSFPELKVSLEKWADFNLEHLRHEEKTLVPVLPKLLTHDEGVNIVKGILEIDPEEYESFHLPFVFKCLKPGQKYSYVSILKECSTPEQFQKYESILTPMVPSDSWQDFSSDLRWS